MANKVFEVQGHGWENQWECNDCKTGMNIELKQCPNCEGKNIVQIFKDGKKIEELPIQDPDYKIEIKGLDTLSMKTFLGGKDSKEKPLIEDFIPEQSIISIWGEPGCCKSFVTNYISACIATKSKFLGQYPCRKVPVMYLCTENPKKIEKKRFKAVFRGMKINPIRRNYKNLQLEYVPRNQIGLLNDERYFALLKNKIRESKIKLLVIDTLSPMIADTDDNKAREIVEIFNNRLFPLVDEFKLSILFLLHSQKTGKDFLGSVKLKASADLSYELKREDDNTLNLYCHKGREGEVNYEFKIAFTNKEGIKPYKVDFSFIKSYEGKQTIKSKGVEIKKIDQAKEIILEELVENELFYIDMVNLGKDIGISNKTMQRAIQNLYKDRKIIKQKGKDRGYTLP